MSVSEGQAGCLPHNEPISLVEQASSYCGAGFQPASRSIRYSRDAGRPHREPNSSVEQASSHGGAGFRLLWSTLPAMVEQASGYCGARFQHWWSRLPAIVERASSHGGAGFRLLWSTLPALVEQTSGYCGAGFQPWCFRLLWSRLPACFDVHPVSIGIHRTSRRLGIPQHRKPTDSSRIPNPKGSSQKPARSDTQINLRTKAPIGTDSLPDPDHPQVHKPTCNVICFQLCDLWAICDERWCDEIQNS